MTTQMHRVFQPALAAALLCLAACESEDEKYREQLEAHFEQYQANGQAPPPEAVPMLTRSLKAEELDKMGGRAGLDDINGHPGDDPVPLQEVKESFVAYYNTPYGAEGEREAWVRFMRALDHAEEIRQRGNAGQAAAEPSQP